MKPIDIIIILIIAVILGATIAYIVRAKKKGTKCIGCPAGDCCAMKSKQKNDPSASSKSGCGCGCDLGCHTEK